MDWKFFSQPGVIFYILWLALMIRLFAVALRNAFAPVRTVKATVIDKHTLESFSKYSQDRTHVRYVVVFLAEGKKKSFYVSAFSYQGYHLKESGTLKYKGDRLISFL